MTFLPIAERELRVAARKRGTFWLRVVAALVGLLIGGGFMVIGRLDGLNSVRLGSTLFSVLTWMAMAVALAAGLFFTSDCLSEEKRDGTLGFLFLTDLRGYDVVGGKLLATSLRGAFALLAIFPVLAITLLMGGLSGAQFWKTVLALANTLFYSLVVGLLSSALSRDAQQAMIGTVMRLLLLIAGGPIADGLLAMTQARGFSPWLSLTSPAYAFVAAGAWGPSGYWPCLLLSHALAWLWFGLASRLAPRTWQETRRQSGAIRSAWYYWWRFGSAGYRATLRSRLLGRNPALWLAARERWQALGVWIMAGLLVAGLSIWMIASKQDAMIWAAWGMLSALFWLLLYLWMASQACRFFVEARRSGLLELLLATPLTVEQIVQGQWHALVRLFGLPIAVMLGAQLLGTFLGQQVTLGRVTISSGLPSNTMLMGFVTAVASVASTAANLIALSWFGMWMGLTSRNVNFATLKTILFVQVIPLLVITFVTGIISMALMFPRIRSGPPGALGGPWMQVCSTLIPVCLSLIKDAAFFFWTRARLYSSFRWQATRAIVTALDVPSNPRRSPPPPLLHAS